MARSGNIMQSSIKELLWHDMRANFVTCVPTLAGSELLMCCACGRLLPQAAFDLEHIIPKQLLKLDPAEVRADKDKPQNVRARNILLCKAPLKVDGFNNYGTGCNAWKGRFYDPLITELLQQKGWGSARFTTSHQVAALCLAYLALVSEFGYRVVLMPSGLLMRRQFFSPRRFLPDMPLRHQIILGGSSVTIPPDAPFWAKPFSFTLKPRLCVVGMRTLAIIAPMSDDPTLPLARHLRIVPSKYKLRPNFFLPPWSGDADF